MLADSSHRDDRWRLFFAWRPSEDLRRFIREAFADAGSPDGLRWVPEENLHITLYFAGNTIPEDVSRLVERSGKFIRQLCPFSLKAEGFRFRGKPGRATMVWLAFSKDTRFTDAHNSLKDIASDLVEPSVMFNEPVPHITIARMGRRFRNESLMLPLSAGDISVTIGRIELWRSEKSGAGVRYSCIEGWPLSGT